VNPHASSVREPLSFPESSASLTGMRQWLSILVLLAFVVPQGLAFACPTDTAPVETAAVHDVHAQHGHGHAGGPAEDSERTAPDRHHGEGAGCTMAMPCGAAALALVDTDDRPHLGDQEAAPLILVTTLHSSDPTRDPPPPRRPV
jgi:hypothetical protein